MTEQSPGVRAGTPGQREDAPRADAPAASSQGALGPLLGVLAAAGVFLAYLVYMNWYTVGYPIVQPVRDRITQRLEAREFARKSAMDPAPGTRLPDPPVEEVAAGGHGSPGSPTVTVFAGPLSSCCSGALDEPARELRELTRDATGGRARTVLVFAASAEAVQAYMLRYHPPYSVLTDEAGRLATEYNAFWTPRVYVVADGHLRWIQKSARLDRSEVVRAVQEARSLDQAGVR